MYILVTNIELILFSQKMLGPFLAPEPATNETGHLDSVLERNFLVKDEESSKQIVKMMTSSQDLSVEFRLLIVAAFRNSCAHNQDLTKQLLLNCENTTMIGAKIMDRWMYEATKNLEYLATTVTDEKRWFHALTAPFLVMECLKVLWHCLMTEKKELLIDKRNQLNKLHGEFGLDWNQPDYLEDVSTSRLTVSRAQTLSYSYMIFAIILPSYRSRHADIPLELMRL